MLKFFHSYLNFQSKNSNSKETFFKSAKKYFEFFCETQNVDHDLALKGKWSELFWLVNEAMKNSFGFSRELKVLK